MASILQVSNETKSSSVRTTKDGRQIRYALQVIQQPERARACGSGAKSSADRRPVDPPPIVELRVFEGEQEITFAYNANFFLFATLENARVIAPGRGNPSTTPSFPVLTGTPVAGMAYLDRPTPAGYFIFPDLSVRHEGKYRLSFALYEELKDPKDMDPEDRSITTTTQQGVDAHVCHRLEVKSQPFVVFSAKKFPGLSESTALSRMVAEQGCRVRIRRDVRMRRRENKSNKDWDNYDEEDPYEQSRRTTTPDVYNQQPGMPTPNQSIDDQRPRSVSNASNSSFAPPRRPSMDELPQSYQAPNGYQSMPPPQTTGYSPMQPYGSSQSQYSSQYAPPQPAPAPMQPPQAPYSHTAHQPQTPTHNYPSPSYNNYVNNHSYQQQSHYEPSPPVRQEHQVEYSQPASDYRRSSVSQPPQQYPGPSQMIPPFSPMEYSRPPSQQMPQPIHPYHNPSQNSPPNSLRMPNGTNLAPLKTLQPPLPLERLDPVPVSPSFHSPPNSISAPIYSHQPATPSSQSGLGQKRSFSTTFNTSHVTGRLQDGTRPDPSGPGYTYESTYDEPDIEDPNRSAMCYRRADGTQRLRPVPTLGN
ncbi:hypothetical protein DM02DRAFT_510121 [Periconia macrospinosa]|uniref:Velvet domain-containing protein n=1 Tax=Periconia macrospinosa TaxID=97972 RepID=A0A2V1EDR2_9PLEO|nr:hypothetical protein DM02DRAFT_510121 [Periconia macrospinosa]